MPHEKDVARLYHIWEAATEAIAFTHDRTPADLATDRLLQLGLTRLLEIIGEAANALSAPMRQQFPDIPWHDIVSMRNRMIHAYFEIDLEIVWKTVSDDLPVLIQAIEPILRDAHLVE